MKIVLHSIFAICMGIRLKEKKKKGIDAIALSFNLMDLGSIANIFAICMGINMGIENFTCNLKKYRQLKGMTQEQLASAVGVRRETIMRLEKAQYNPSLKLAIDISKVVEVSIEEIFIFD